MSKALLSSNVLIPLVGKIILSPWNSGFKTTWTVPVLPLLVRRSIRPQEPRHVGTSSPSLLLSPPHSLLGRSQTQLVWSQSFRIESHCSKSISSLLKLVIICIRSLAESGSHPRWFKWREFSRGPLKGLQAGLREKQRMVRQKARAGMGRVHSICSPPVIPRPRPVRRQAARGPGWQSRQDWLPWAGLGRKGGVPGGRQPTLLLS